MEFELLHPPAEVQNDLRSLAKAIAADGRGDRARKLVSYFQKAELSCLEMKLRCKSPDTRQYAALLADALGSSGRIVAAVWQREHGKALLR